MESKWSQKACEVKALGGSPELRQDGATVPVGDASLGAGTADAVEGGEQEEGGQKDIQGVRRQMAVTMEA